MYCPKCGQDNEPQSKFCQSCGSDLEVSGSVYQNEVGIPGFALYAGFWKRFVAVIIDGILLNAVCFVIGFMMGLVWGYLGGDEGAIGVYSSLFGIALGWLYYAILESSTVRATVGKMALGIVVTDLYGEQLSFGRATGRHFAKIISSIILMIGFIMAGFTQRKQALHDIIAGTLVVNKY